MSGLGPHLIKECLTASLQDGMDIARIQAYANNLEKQQQLQRGKHDFDKRNSRRARYSGAVSEFRVSQRQQYSRHLSQSVASAPPRSTGKRFDHLIYSGSCQSSRILGFQYRDDSGWVRPPSPHRVGHMMCNFPLRNSRDKAQPIGSAVGSSSSLRPLVQGSQVSAGLGRGRGGASSSSGPQNRIYALVGRQDFETSPDVVTGKLLAFSHDVYVLIDLSSTLLCVIPYIAG
ncbi:uncharacterized protein LOC132042853 [Lycium ferocissimum]|uniref:uncharacterized protein LOC132042853 n=1 Tax=Lycium ferocissimum TaxID=112874 RepID=UPI002814B859|nr:uncharacterized protein LOC132042853 [Lycium ferocissimum]